MVLENVGEEATFLTAGLTGQHRLGRQQPVDTVFAEPVRPDRLVPMQGRGCRGVEQGERDGLDIEGSRGDEGAGHESRRGAEQSEASVGSAECEEVRRGGEEADRRADDVEVRREIDDADRHSRGTGLSHAEAAEEGRISKGQRAPQRVTHAEREEHTNVAALTAAGDVSPLSSWTIFSNGM